MWIDAVTPILFPARPVYESFCCLGCLKHGLEPVNKSLNLLMYWCLAKNAACGESNSGHYLSTIRICDAS